MNIKIPTKIILCMLLVVLVVACKTTETKDNSNLHATSQKPTLAEMDASMDIALADIMNNENLDAVTKELMIVMMKKAIESPETFTSDLQKMNENMLYVFPNPTAGAVTVEFARDFPFKNIDMTMKGGITLDLYYMGKKINTLEFHSVKDNKVTISSDYLQNNGTYTITIPGLENVSTSFVVKK